MCSIAILIALVSAAWEAGAARSASLAASLLMECGTHGDVEILCGTRSPEDLEETPDGKYLIVSQFVNGRGRRRHCPALELLDLAAKTYSKIPITAEPRKDWGDPACPGPVNDKMVPHGISLGKRTGGAMQLYVVNHGGGRQSIEMYEGRAKQTSGELVAGLARLRGHQSGIQRRGRVARRQLHRHASDFADECRLIWRQAHRSGREVDSGEGRDNVAGK